MVFRKITHALFLVMLPLAVAHGATLTVTTTSDTTANDGVCSLREAIGSANSNAASGAANGECPAGDSATTDRVVLPAGTFNLSSTLTIAEDLVLQGVSKTDTVLDGGNSVRVLNLVSGADLEVVQLRVANGSTASPGAGLYATTNSVVTIRDSQFSGNASTGTGGAIFSNYAFLNVYDSTFTNNSGSSGGAIYGDYSTVTIRGSSFSGNSASNSGGAIYNEYGLLDIKASSLTSNSASSEGGALFCYDYGVIELEDVTLTSNTAGGDAGAIYMEYYSLLTVRNSQLDNNSAGSDGGAIYAYYSATVDLVNTRVSGNEASSDGGGLYIDEGTLNALDSQIDNNISGDQGGGFYLDYPGSASLTGTSLMGNTAANDGGGVYLYYAPLTLFNVSIGDNTATSGEGGGIHSEAGPMRIEQSILRDNVANSGGGGIYADDQVSMTLTNTTVSGNSVSNGDGGGLYLDSSIQAELRSVTLVDNAASGSGGGIHKEDTGSLLAYNNSIIAGNTATSDADCAIEQNTLSRGFNVLGNGTGCPTQASDQSINAPAVFDDLLAPLAGNGGPTLTHALVAGSIGDNAGDNDNCPDVDQRGTQRQQNGRSCDVGAYERVNAASSSGGGGGSMGGWLALLGVLLLLGRKAGLRSAVQH